MARKPKEIRYGNPNSSASSSSDNIFEPLFGGSQEPNNPTSVSKSSYSNPNDDSQSILLKLQKLSPPKIDIQVPESKLRKRKRKEKISDSVDLDDSDVEGEVKKLKRGNGLDAEGLNFDEEEKKNKKKRKRLEVEAEYEERKHGVMDLGDGAEERKVEIGKKRKKLDSEEDMLVSKERYDDEEKLLRTVFVGNLPLKVKKKALLGEFGQFGDIEFIGIHHIHLLDDKSPMKGATIKKPVNDGVDRVNTYIVFKTEESAQASFSHNMAVMGGNHIHVNRACPPRKKLKGEILPLYDSTRTIFICNLPFDVKDEELYQLFTGIHDLKDSIEAVWVVQDPTTSMGNGTAYVMFKTQEAANMVVRKHKLKIQDKELRLSCVFKSNPTSSKRKDSPSASSYNSSNKRLALCARACYQETESDVQRKIPTGEEVVNQRECTEKRASADAMKTGGGGGDGDGGGASKRQRPESHVHVSLGDDTNKKARRL